MRETIICTLLGFLISVSGCSEMARLPEDAGTGPRPVLPAPNSTLIPTIQVAPAIGWPADAKPTPAAGLEVNAFAKDLDHPRWLYVLPNGDVLVAETNAPPRPEDGRGIKGWFMKRAMKKVGAATPSANRITLLRDTNGDGVPDVRTVFLQGLNSPFGMTLVGRDLYVANTDAIVRFPYKEGATQISEPGTKVADLPAGPLNHHWTKNVIASRDGSRLYVTVGSNSNVAENGIEKEDRRAAILEVNPKTGESRVYASGLRNPNGLAWQPRTGVLWTTVNERDELGSDLVPDYMTSVKEGGFYGWPYSYFGQHGSWNRNPPSGYRVLFVPFADGRPVGAPEYVLTGFLDAEGKALGRPVGVAVDRAGALLVADDVGNIVWRVTPASAKVNRGSDRATR
jgi:glucose/arabinose dehydrogenase